MSESDDPARLEPHIAQLCDLIITARLHLVEVTGDPTEADRLVRLRMRQIAGRR